MARYVNRKHGLVIGSGDQFAAYDAHEKNIKGPWRAVVWASPYCFTQITAANATLTTPAEQMMFRDNQPRASTRNWLDRHFGEGEWAAVRSRPDSLVSPLKFYFRTRQAASDFVKYIETQLMGITCRG